MITHCVEPSALHISAWRQFMKTAEAYSAPLPPLWQQMAAADVPLALWVKQHVPAAVHHGDWGVRHGPPDALGNCLPAAIPQYGCSGTFGDAAGLYQAPAGLCGEGCWAQSVAGLAGYVGAVVRWAGPISPLPLIGATKAPWAGFPTHSYLWSQNLIRTYSYLFVLIRTYSYLLKHRPWTPWDSIDPPKQLECTFLLFKKRQDTQNRKRGSYWMQIHLASQVHCLPAGKD